MDTDLPIKDVHPADVLKNTVENRVYFSTAIKKMVKHEANLRIQSLTPIITDKEEELLTIDPSTINIVPICNKYTDSYEKHPDLKAEIIRHTELLKMIKKRNACPIAQIIDKI